MNGSQAGRRPANFSRIPILTSFGYMGGSHETRHGNSN
jgi:hypothetical protein